MKLSKPSRAVVDHWITISCAPPPTDPPSVWLEKNFVFNEEQIKGPWDFTGRNYLRRLIDDNGNPAVREQTVVTGTGCGKTIAYTGGICWKIKFKPCRGIYVMPSQKGEGSASNYVDTRLIEDIKATPALAELLPTKGQIRFKLNKQHVRLNGSHFGFVGGNSAAQVGSNRCGDVRMDETDKFPQKIKNEAGTGALVRNRTKGVEDFQIFDTSTPTIKGGIIWPRLMRSNLHLYFLPCPHCNGGKHSPNEDERAAAAINAKLKGWMVYIWNKQYSAGLPTAMDGVQIPFAEVKWDSAAKGRDGVWNFQKIQETAHFECPHCKGKIFDFENGKIKPDIKNWMDANGCWICVKPGVPGHVGYHASSLYAPVINEESTLGGRAVEFLSCEGGSIQDFINSTLALPEMGQRFISTDLIEVGKDLPRTSSTLWLPMMSIDRQEKFPGFWFVVRRWIISVLSAMPTELPAEVKKLDAPEVEIARCDYWKQIAAWLTAKNLTGPKLKEFYHAEFSSNLIRLIEYICNDLKIKLPRQGDSEALEVGSGDSWEEMEEAQARWKVANCDIIADARFGSMDNAEVFAECFRRCPRSGFVFYSPTQTAQGLNVKFSQQPFPGARPFALHGWTPCMGFPEHKTWPSRDKIRLPYGQVVNDPFSGKMEQKQFFQYVFQFDAQWALSELSRIRKRYQWQLAPGVKFTGLSREMRDMTETITENGRHIPRGLSEYNRHMKGYFWNEAEQMWDAPSKHGGSQSRSHPNHLYDCEKNMVARAVWKGIFKYENTK